MRIVVAMSGGVDSSVAAGLLKEQGHEVIGLAMKTHNLAPKQNRACCTPDDMRDARRVSDILEIPFYVLNYAELFEEMVIAPFAAAYRDGYTPNPCVECNDKVKFVPMLERAKLLGADKLATGHYARIEDIDGTLLLRRGVDPRKDQSYFLFRLSQAQLGELSFPLGDMTKDEVRDHARRMGLPTAEKDESQEICFVGAEGYAATVETILDGAAPPPGNIVDVDGKVLGRHKGIHHYTLGQRRGLGIAAPQPLYVCHIDAATNEVVVGREALLQTQEVIIHHVTWTAGPPNADDVLLIQQRYRETPKAGRVVSIAGNAGDTNGITVTVRFDSPVGRGAPGQAAVICQEDRVVGGGVIAPMSKSETSALRNFKSLVVLNNLDTPANTPPNNPDESPRSAL